LLHQTEEPGYGGEIRLTPTRSHGHSAIAGRSTGRAHDRCARRGGVGVPRGGPSAAAGVRGPRWRRSPALPVPRWLQCRRRGARERRGWAYPHLVRV